MRRYSGLAGLDTGLSGLDILRSTAFLRPVQIMRQFVSNLKTGNSHISAYHANKGLSSLPQNGGESRRITNIPGRITNPISGYEGLADMQETLVWKKKGLMVFLFCSVAPCKSMIKNQKYKIVKGAI